MNVSIPNFQHKLSKDLSSIQIEIGILQDRPEVEALSSEKGLKRLTASQVALKAGRKSITTVVEVFKKFDNKYKLLTAPFEKNQNKEVVNMLDQMIKEINGDALNIRRLENTAQAVIRNPILRGDYGSNKETTEAIKGFNKLFIRTGTMFKAIKARVIK